MKITKQARRDAKQLFNGCKVNGLLEDGKIRQTVQAVISRKPRSYLAVLQHFQRLVKLDIARRTAVVESAVNLTPEFQNSISANLGAKHGSGLNLTFVTNPELIGGLRIKVGSDVYDGSIAGRLNTLQEVL